MYDRKPSPDASAQITGGPDAPQLRGYALFYQKHDHVLAEVHVTGLPQNNASGYFGLHIHAGGSCSGAAFADTGSHYNPTAAQHPSHAGDLPPLLLCNGGAWMSVRTERFRVQDIIGRTVVIHSGPDDFHTQPAGSAGTKIACGVIEKR